MNKYNSVPFVLALMIITLCILFILKEFYFPISFLWKISLIPSKVQKGEIWRIIISPLFQTNIYHLILNVFVLFQIGQNLELLLGHFGFFLHTMIILIISGVFYSFVALLTTLFDFFKTFNSPILGMTSIISALSVVDVYITEQKYRSMFYLFHVPAQFYPYCLFISFAIALPKCSILNMICGLIVGNVYSIIQFKRVPKKADMKREKSNHYITSIYSERDQNNESFQPSPFAIFTLSWLEKDRRFSGSDKL